MRTKYKYFHFEKMSAMFSDQLDGIRPKSEESPSWFCISNRGKLTLGVVKWFADWKQFCFFPEEDTVFSGSCLVDVVEFVDQWNELHNKERG